MTVGFGGKKMKEPSFKKRKIAVMMGGLLERERFSLRPGKQS